MAMCWQLTRWSWVNVSMNASRPASRVHFQRFLACIAGCAFVLVQQRVPPTLAPGKIAETGSVSDAVLYATNLCAELNRAPFLAPDERQSTVALCMSTLLLCTGRAALDVEHSDCLFGEAALVLEA